MVLGVHIIYSLNEYINTIRNIIGDFSELKERPRWIQRYHRYRITSELNLKPEEIQVICYYTAWEQKQTNC